MESHQIPLIKISRDATIRGVKVEYDFGGIGISHEKSICALREKGGSIAGRQEQGYVLVQGSNLFFPCLDFIM